jgi:hypothetical protein
MVNQNMKRILLAALLLYANVLAAQRSKSVFLELIGNGGVASVNFDSRVNKSEKGFGYRAGFGFIPPAVSFFTSTPTIWTIPVGVNHLAGKAPHYFESGLGVTYYFFSGTTSDFWGITENDKGSGILFFPSAGYRYAPLGKSFQGRAVLCPVINQNGAYFWFGLSAGYKF